MLNDNWIHVFITHDEGQVAAFLPDDNLIRRDAAAGAVGLEAGPANGGSVFVGRSSWTM